MLSLFTDDTRRNPYPLYDRMRQATPLVQDPASGVYAVFSYDGVRRALHDPESFSSRAAPPGDRPLEWMIFQDPPRHTQLRAIVMRAFTPAAIASLENRIRTLSRELLDQVASRGEMDLVLDYAVPLPLLVIAELIGIPPADRALFRRWADAILGLVESLGGGERKERAAATFRAAREEMVPYLAELVRQRRAQPREDLLTRIAVAEVEGERLDGEELLWFFQLLLVAGSETTTNLISNAVLCLAESEDQRELLLSNPALVPKAVEEVLRYRTPVQAVFRQTRREVEMHGQVIPPDKLVLVMIGSANRDPAAFADPNRFSVARDPNPHVSFGHGIHFCLGAALARLEGRIALSDMLERLPRFRLADDAPWEPRPAFHVHGPTRLPLRFEPEGATGG